MQIYRGLNEKLLKLTSKFSNGVKQDLRYQRIVDRVNKNNWLLDVWQVVDAAAPLVHLMSWFEIVDFSCVGFVEFGQSCGSWDVSLYESEFAFDFVGQKHVAMFHDDALDIFSEDIQVEALEVLPSQQTLGCTGNQSLKYPAIVCKQKKTYTVASYPWQMEIPPMMFAGFVTPFSPKYFVTRLPPSEKPTDMRWVDGYFLTRLLIIAA